MTVSHRCVIDWGHGHTRSIDVTEARNAYVAARRTQKLYQAFNCVIRVHGPIGSELLACWRVDAAGGFTRLMLE